MGKMTNLTSLKLDHNILRGSLIAEVRQLSKLKYLDLSYNNMTGVPARIGQLKNLQTLNYSYNDVTDFPNEISNLAGTLKTLDLTANPIEASKISKLKSQLPNTNIIY